MLLDGTDDGYSEELWQYNPSTVGAGHECMWGVDVWQTDGLEKVERTSLLHSAHVSMRLPSNEVQDGYAKDLQCLSDEQVEEWASSPSK